jgi:fido (protein-threonine AMPylation protein)
MGQHDNCRSWDYENHPKQQEVARRCNTILSALGKRPRRFDRYGCSTKVGHRFLFTGLTPAACPYLAGNYRGESFPCLINYRVKVHGDPKVGVEPPFVAIQMAMFDQNLAVAIKKFDETFSATSAKCTPEVLLVQFVSILANFLTMFLTIHPFANGNGHTGRLLIWVLMTRFGFWPVCWPLDASPNYGQALTDHRNGKKATLENFLLKSIIGP